jgi:N-acetyl-1-D-myo-inositol-2-amino-2-deoxy-alpha-D-glucopyranoside deacetylase
MRRVLLGIFPHPDDEAYSAAGTMALAARAGAEVQVLCATRGEGGEISDPSLATPATLGDVRAAELAASCRVIGAHPPRFLGYRDGTLADVNLPEAVGRIVRVIRSVRPQVVITFGADGVYGHPDHVALHKLVMPAFRAAAGGTRFPEDEYGPAFAPRRLLWTAFPRGLFRPMWEKLLSTDLAPAIRQLDPEKLGVDPGEFAVAVDIRAVAEVKLAALRCHRTQLPDGDPRSVFPAGIVPLLLAVEYFQLGAGESLPEGARDVFAGL